MPILYRDIADDRRGKSGNGNVRKPAAHLQTNRQWRAAFYRNGANASPGMPGVVFKQENEMKNISDQKNGSHDLSCRRIRNSNLYWETINMKRFNFLAPR